ncbi:MAG: hypothetical protein HKL91_01360 [Candidatus Eremiobacteraeota bacterium]|nr:hypothetical protein [Candidatus Eremiobacteraeota bacterium]
MQLRSLIAAALAAVLLGAAPATTRLYSAPAGNRPAGIPHPDLPYVAILPSGRIVAPVGRSIAIGANVNALALIPGGRFAVVGGSAASGGTLLRTIDTRTMQIVARVTNAGSRSEAIGGLIALHDPAMPARTILVASEARAGKIAIFAVGSEGTLAQLHPGISLPGGDPEPMHLALAESGHLLLVADDRNGRVDTIDLATRRPIASMSVGALPSGLAAFGPRIFAAGAAADASNLAIRSLDSSAVSSENIPLDAPLDGATTIGGVDPESVAIEPGGRFAYVTLAGVDRVVAVALDASPRVVDGIDLRLFANAPYGTMPTAMVPSMTGRELFVALSGLNAVAVLDASTPGVLHRLGLIPTGARPVALSLAPNDKVLFVANAEGNGVNATLERIALTKIPLERTTLSALRYARVSHLVRGNALVPPLRSGRKSDAISHVVDISLGPTYFNSTPNLRALANEFAVVGDYYADAPTSELGSQLTYSGTISPSAWLLDTFRGRRAVEAMPPDLYPRSGYIVNALARAGMSYRVYGAMLPEGPLAIGIPLLHVLHGAVGYSPKAGERASDRALATAFVAQYSREAASGNIPAYQAIELSSNNPLVQDRALGRIVEAIVKSEAWGSTAIFISPRQAIGATTADPKHSFAVIVSPYARRGFLGHAHASTASVLKTEEEILGLPALSLGDLLASDLANYFTPTLDLSVPNIRTNERMQR